MVETSPGARLALAGQRRLVAKRLLAQWRYRSGLRVIERVGQPRLKLLGPQPRGPGAARRRPPGGWELEPGRPGLDYGPHRPRPACSACPAAPASHRVAGPKGKKSAAPPGPGRPDSMPQPGAHLLGKPSEARCAGCGGLIPNRRPHGRGARVRAPRKPAYLHKSPHRAGGRFKAHREQAGPAPRRGPRRPGPAARKELKWLLTKNRGRHKAGIKRNLNALIRTAPPRP